MSEVHVGQPSSLRERLRQRLRQGRDERRLRRWLRAELAAIDVQRPVGMSGVCRRLGQRRGKDIRVLSYPLHVPGPFGLWLSTPTADYILYQQQTTALHQEHIIAHELGHVLAGHGSDEEDDSVWQELMPDVPPEMIRRALRRSAYDTHQEREAEVIATVLLESAATHASVSLPARTPRARRVQEALSDRQRWL